MPPEFAPASFRNPCPGHSGIGAQVTPEYALKALQIGVLALSQARTRIDADTIRQEGTRILETLHQQLGDHASQLQERMARTLGDYFDPKSGRFEERIGRLLKDGGDLEQVLRRAVGPEGSELACTLVKHVGEKSPLVRLLDPKSSDGLLRALEGGIEQMLDHQRSTILREFSLDNGDGALVRLLAELRGRHGELQKWMQEQMDSVVREFSLDSEDSALSRLVQRVEGAQETIAQEFSLDNRDSALSRLALQLEQTRSAINRELTLDDDGSALSRLRRELTGLLDRQGEQNTKFQEEVSHTLIQFTTRRKADSMSPAHGDTFETSVCSRLQWFADARGDLFEACGTRTGQIRNCKVGDAVITLGPDNVASGVRIAVEAKENESYTVAGARGEMDTARKNRDAGVGLFVLSRKCASPDDRLIRRFDSDVIILWDAEDPVTDIVLEVGLELARALAVRQGKSAKAQAADLQALDKAVLEIEKRIQNLDDVSKYAETIKNSSLKILDRVRVDREALSAQVELLREKLAGLRQLLDEEVE
jgi:hypothetical protein